MFWYSQFLATKRRTFNNKIAKIICYTRFKICTFDEYFNLPNFAGFACFLLDIFHNFAYPKFQIFLNISLQSASSSARFPTVVMLCVGT